MLCGSPGTLSKYVKCITCFVFQAINLVKPGGILVYSTCTITLEENEHNVSWVLEHFPQMQLVAINSEIGSPGITQVNHNSGLWVEKANLITRPVHLDIKRPLHFKNFVKKKQKLIL